MALDPLAAVGPATGITLPAQPGAIPTLLEAIPLGRLSVQDALAGPGADEQAVTADVAQPDTVDFAAPALRVPGPFDEPLPVSSLAFAQSRGAVGPEPTAGIQPTAGLTDPRRADSVTAPAEVAEERDVASPTALQESGAQQALERQRQIELAGRNLDAGLTTADATAAATAAARAVSEPGGPREAPSAVSDPVFGQRRAAVEPVTNAAAQAASAQARVRDPLAPPEPAEAARRAGQAEQTQPAAPPPPEEAVPAEEELQQVDAQQRQAALQETATQLALERQRQIALLGPDADAVPVTTAAGEVSGTAPDRPRPLDEPAPGSLPVAAQNRGVVEPLTNTATQTAAAQAATRDPPAPTQPLAAASRTVPSEQLGTAATSPPQIPAPDGLTPQQAALQRAAEQEALQRDILQREALQQTLSQQALDQQWQAQLTRREVGNALTATATTASAANPAQTAPDIPASARAQWAARVAALSDGEATLADWRLDAALNNDAPAPLQDEASGTAPQPAAMPADPQRQLESALQQQALSPGLGNMQPYMVYGAAGSPPVRGGRDAFVPGERVVGPVSPAAPLRDVLADAPDTVDQVQNMTGQRQGR
ncbi:hypothetical protein N8I74_14635 [Chitiniphilus purpureus]|uniref:Flagellar hook-length control protein FliK n=1 Tax=Chitiniphilus purpureus TaxID=2981137 RepID=A0ABY6DM37_9NEIS|nr:hypothetical protein [Chitiniphilus sp. CD1]UXY14546.1 hypothetical protein N8I74_14635 [Chitiniphilus sp. CD1]